MTIQYAGDFQPTSGPDNATVGVIQGMPYVLFYRTLYLVAVPDQYQNTDLSVTVRILGASHFDMDGPDSPQNPLDPLSPIQVSLVQGNASTDTDPLHALTRLLGITTPPDLGFQQDLAVYFAPVVPDSTVTLTPAVSTTQ